MLDAFGGEWHDNIICILISSQNRGISVSGGFEDIKELDNAISSVIGEDGEYFFQAGARQRVLSVLSEIHLAYQGKQDAFQEGNDISSCTVRILWPEAAFVGAILDNFIMLAEAKKLYVNRLPLEMKRNNPTVFSAYIALIHFFQDLIWSELERVVNEWQVRAVFGQYNILRKMYFKFPQLDGYCTQWLDILNTQYLFSEPEQRRFYLVYVLKIFLVDEEYISLKDSIKVFKEQDGILVTHIRFSDCWMKNCEW